MTRLSDLSSSNFDNELPRVSSWEQLMILDPNSTVQPETTFMLSHKWAICDEATCMYTLIQSRDQILESGKILTRRTRATKH